MSKLFSWLIRFFSAKKPYSESFSRNTDNLPTILSQEDKLFFINFCQFVWIQGEPLPLIYDIEDEAYTRQGITLSSLKHLQTIGLVEIALNGFVKKRLGKHTRLFYVGKPTKIGFAGEVDNQLDF